ncbi:ABC transporter permease [Cohnella abietis]|uniref:Peptide ABC transporter permease n=1 Tax=Cohnella abietis TaxID=2507935 RepID=A0A3T1DAX9_9BACL|nr:ABC transporter permease [Cohnella abietis]BBI35229.1 peptide ABC transporter permease [Cohnella abietis]
MTQIKSPAVPSIWRGRKRKNVSLVNGKRSLFTRIMIVGSGLLIACLILFAIAPEWIAPYSPTEMNTTVILKEPSGSYWLGTDYFGRDIFSLIVFGSRDALLIGISAVLLGGSVGAIIGAVAGYAGRMIDSILMRLIDTLMTIPGILLALTISAVLGPSKFNLIIAVSVSGIPGFARVIRGQVLAIKSRPFIEAARANGTSHFSILFRHIAPHAFSSLLIMGTMGVGSAILMGSGLSFLGLGSINEIPDWGGLLSQGRSYISVAWWIATFPGLAITLLVVSINLLGDELQAAVGPRKG